MAPFSNAVPYLEAGRVADAREFRVNRWDTVLDFPAHLHAQVEMIYVREGILEVQIDNQTQIMHPGDFAVAFPNTIHAYRPVGGLESDVDILFYIFFPHMAGDFASRISTHVPVAPFVKASDLPEETHFSLERLVRQQEQFRSAVAKAYLQIVLDGVWSLIQPVREEGRLRDLPHRILKYMTEHFRQPITAESVARDLGISRNYLSAIFGQKLNMSFHQCLNTLRIELARELLRTTDRSITDILYECGYESSRTFNRVFVDLSGVTPREYRSQFQRIMLAAELLKTTDRPISDIRSECGYEDDYTFVRVFYDLHGRSPEEFRQSHHI